MHVFSLDNRYMLCYNIHMSKIEQVISNWHIVDTKNDYYSQEKMLVWALEKCQGKFYHRGNRFWFHNDKDATIFALKYADSAGEKTVFSS